MMTQSMKTDADGREGKTVQRRGEGLKPDRWRDALEPATVP